MPNRKDYPKKILSFDKQIELLQERGMIINDVETAKSFLKNISYFRLQGFWWEFQIDKNNHTFKPNTTFESVIDLYTFDRKLRLLLFDALERIEIALRTKMIYYLSIEKEQWWFEDKNIFFNESFFIDSLDDIDKELARTKEIFIESHYNKYSNENRPPAYKTLEVVSFGCLSKIYSNLKNDITAKDRIAKEFNLPNASFLKSWLQSFNTIRNIIAHHSRLWNRNIDFPPKSLHKTEFNFIEIPSNLNSVFHCISCIVFVLNKVSEGHTVKEKIIELLNENPSIALDEMGFPKNWKEQPLWS
ncbi:Abi family protein [Flavobacterium tibetense]|uniref:Abi family protein n=1 Tax=Flavobacterium tibetense TaxID=2233533 RepID=A0A365P173_9FLAO|nr:Abi family protein [Flavobacterium tibetense]RBA28274.1 Abi family protein [Flavobacterium tibetense]